VESEQIKKIAVRRAPDKIKMTNQPSGVMSRL